MLVEENKFFVLAPRRGATFNQMKRDGSNKDFQKCSIELPNDEVSDTTVDDSSNEAGKQNNNIKNICNKKHWD